MMVAAESLFTRDAYVKEASFKSFVTFTLMTDFTMSAETVVSAS